MMNAVARMSDQGQIVVPQSVRDAHGWTEGTALEFIENGNGVRIQAVPTSDPRFPPITPEEFLAGRIRIDIPFPTDAEIEETLLDEAGRRFDATGS